jgi:hypothetical protein
MASVIVDEAHGVLQEESAFKHGCNIYRTAGVAKES